MKLEVYRRADGLYAWRLKAKNGRIIATDGGQGYVRRRACAEAAIGALGTLRVGPPAKFGWMSPTIVLVHLP